MPPSKYLAVIPPGSASQITISQPMLSTRQLQHAQAHSQATMTLSCLNCDTDVYVVDKPWPRPGSSSAGRTTVGFSPSTVESPLESSQLQGSKVGSNVPSQARKVSEIAPEDDILRPDPSSGTLWILPNCLQGNDSIAKAAASEFYSKAFGLKIESAHNDRDGKGDGISSDGSVAVGVGNLQHMPALSATRRARSPGRFLSPGNDDSSSSPSPARKRYHRSLKRAEEEEDEDGDDLDALLLLDNLLPPLPTTLFFETSAQRTSSPRRAATSAYATSQTASSSRRKLEVQLDSYGLSELRAQRETAQREIYEVLRAKRKELAKCDQRVRGDARRLLGRRSRSSSKDTSHMGDYMPQSVAADSEPRPEGDQDDSLEASSPLFERKRPMVPPIPADMARTTSTDSSAPNAGAATGTIAMPGRGGGSVPASTGSGVKVGSYLSASFAMRGRDLPLTPASVAEARDERERKEDEEEWYAQKRRLRERYPHADHSALPSAVNSDDEGNVEVKKDTEIDEEDEQRGRGRGRGRERSSGQEREGDVNAQAPEEPGEPRWSGQTSASTASNARKAAFQESSKDTNVRKGALKGNAALNKMESLKERVAPGEKKVAFAETTKVAKPPNVAKSADASTEVTDEGADAVFEIDEEIDGEGTPGSSDISLDPRALAPDSEPDALHSAEVDEEALQAQEVDQDMPFKDDASRMSNNIAQSLPAVGSFSAMAISEQAKKKWLKGDDFEGTRLREEEEAGDFDPASLRIDGRTVYSTDQVLDNALSTLPTSQRHRKEQDVPKTADEITKVYGSRPFTSRKTSYDVDDRTLAGFPQEVKERSSTIGFRIAVGEAEAQLSGLLAPHAPSHRNLWASAERRNNKLGKNNKGKYTLTEEAEDEIENVAAPRSIGSPLAQSAASKEDIDSLARSVPIALGGFTASQNRRMSVNISAKHTIFRDETSGFDLEPKTSLPYQEKKFTPSLRKAMRSTTTKSSSHERLVGLPTIADEKEGGIAAHPATGAAAVPAMTIDAPSDEARAADAKKASQMSVPNSIRKGFNLPSLLIDEVGRIPTSTHSTPLLESKEAQFEPFAGARSSVKRFLSRAPYVQPPPPSTYTLRLQPSEENRPRAIELEQLPMDSSFANQETSEEEEEQDGDDKYVESHLLFMHTLEQLKLNKRTGWLHHRVSQPESIADHMYRMAVLSMLLPNEDLDIGKCVQLCVVHDMAESLVGDLTPLDGVSREEKLRREREALLHLVHDLLGGSPAALQIENLWLEYEDRQTPESRVVKDLDRFELCLQAVEYERRFNVVDLQPFWEGSLGLILHPRIRKWSRQLAREREQLWKHTPFAYEQPIPTGIATARFRGRE